jgi:GNAT superfamily N-acetyltransferase
MTQQKRLMLFIIIRGLKIMDIVFANRNDLKGILELYKQLNGSNNEFAFSDAEKVWDKIETENIKYIIAKDNNVIIASCYIAIIPNLTYNGKSIGFIENVITDEKYRKQGIGREIMNKAIIYAKSQNCYKILLQSGVRRSIAHKFYESIGFNGDSKKAYEMRLNDNE